MSSQSGFDYSGLPAEVQVMVGKEYFALCPQGTTQAAPRGGPHSKLSDASLGGGAALLLVNKDTYEGLRFEYLRHCKTEFKTAAEFDAYMSARAAAVPVNETRFIKSVVFDVAERYVPDEDDKMAGIESDATSQGEDESFAHEAMQSALFKESAIEHVELRGPSLSLHSQLFPSLEDASVDYQEMLDRDRNVELMAFDEAARNFPRSLKTWVVRKRDVPFWLTAALRAVTCEVCAEAMFRDFCAGTAKKLLKDEVSTSGQPFDWAPEAAGHTHDPELTGALFESFDDAKQLALLGEGKRAEYRKTAAYMDWVNLNLTNKLLAERMELHKAVCDVEGICGCWDQSPLNEDNPCAAAH